MINIQSLLSQRQLGNLPSQPKPKPKKEDVNAVMNKSKRIQEDSEEKEGYFPKVVNDILTEKEEVYQTCMDGFLAIAKISACHHLEDVLDDLVVSLCKFTTLLNPSSS